MRRELLEALAQLRLHHPEVIIIDDVAPPVPAEAIKSFAEQIEQAHAAIIPAGGGAVRAVRRRESIMDMMRRLGGQR